MSVNIAIAKEIATGRIVHIDDVDKAKGEVFECCECKQKMSPVKTEARGKAWHFRHTQSTDILKCKSTALHDFAVQVILDNNTIVLTKAESIKYTSIKKEADVFGKRSDVLVYFEGIDLHFDVFVTHDLDQEKIDLYRQHKLKCVKIDLSHPELLTASKDEIIRLVLTQHYNKYPIYWQDEIVKPIELSQSPLKNLLALLAIIVAAILVFIAFFKPRKRRNR